MNATTMDEDDHALLTERFCDPCDPPNDMSGVALSPDDSVLYFTTGGFQAASNGVAALWQVSVQSDGTIGTPSKLVDDIPRARGITTDEAGNIYVASELSVRVYQSDGTALGVIELFSDPADREAYSGRPGRDFTALDVEFGGPHYNVLYVGVGYDRKGKEIVDGGDWSLGGLFRVPLKARGSWVGRHRIPTP